jgi:hypothetical protein
MLAEDRITRDEWLYAADVGLFPIEDLQVGAIYLRRDVIEEADTLFGRAFEEWIEENLSLDIWRFNLNVNSVQRFTWGRRSAEGWVGTDNVKGLGLHGSFSYAQKGLGVLLEAKDYQGLDGGINAPPPANPDGESINEGRDEQGFQVAFDLMPVRWLNINTGYALAWDSDTAQRSILARTGIEARLDMKDHTFTPFLIWIDREIPGSINPENDRLEPGGSYETLIGKVSLHLKGSWRFVAEGTRRWDEPHALLEVGRGPWILSAGGAVVIGEETELWPWGAVRYNTHPFDLTLSYGRFKGEYICKHGVCAYELPFEGLKADLTLYF